MNTEQISVPQGECSLSIFFNRRTVSLLRTGDKGATQFGRTEEGNSYIAYPENNRGWIAVKHTDVQIINVKVEGGNPSFSTKKELGVGAKMTFEEACIGFCHDLAYEVARGANCRLIGWTLTNIQNGQTLNCQGEWQGETFAFKFSNQ